MDGWEFLSQTINKAAETSAKMHNYVLLVSLLWFLNLREKVIVCHKKIKENKRFTMWLWNDCVTKKPLIRANSQVFTILKCY